MSILKAAAKQATQATTQLTKSLSYVRPTDEDVLNADLGLEELDKLFEKKPETKIRADAADSARSIRG